MVAGTSTSPGETKSTNFPTLLPFQAALSGTVGRFHYEADLGSWSTELLDVISAAPRRILRPASLWMAATTFTSAVKLPPWVSVILEPARLVAVSRTASLQSSIPLEASSTSFT